MIKIYSLVELVEHNSGNTIWGRDKLISHVTVEETAQIWGFRKLLLPANAMKR